MSDATAYGLVMLPLIPLHAAALVRGTRSGSIVAATWVLATVAEFATLGFDPHQAWIVALIAAGTGAVCIWFRRITRRSHDLMSGIAADAARRRFRVGSMTRGMVVPIPVGLDDTPEPNNYTQFKSYTADRSTGSGVGDWTYLVRPDKWALPRRSWFAFHASTGEPPKELRDILAEIARVADEERLEFEGFKGEVTAYWRPPGEKVDSTRVFDWLEQLARF